MEYNCDLPGPFVVDESNFDNESNFEKDAFSLSRLRNDSKWQGSFFENIQPTGMLIPNYAEPFNDLNINSIFTRRLTDFNHNQITNNLLNFPNFHTCSVSGSIYDENQDKVEIPEERQGFLINSFVNNLVDLDEDEPRNQSKDTYVIRSEYHLPESDFQNNIFLFNNNIPAFSNIPHPNTNATVTSSAPSRFKSNSKPKSTRKTRLDFEEYLKQETAYNPMFLTNLFYSVFPDKELNRPLDSQIDEFAKYFMKCKREENMKNLPGTILLSTLKVCKDSKEAKEDPDFKKYIEDMKKKEKKEGKNTVSNENGRYKSSSVQKMELLYYYTSIDEQSEELKRCFPNDDYEKLLKVANILRSDLDQKIRDHFVEKSQWGRYFEVGSKSKCNTKSQYGQTAQRGDFVVKFGQYQFYTHREIEQRVEEQQRREHFDQIAIRIKTRNQIQE